MVDSANYRQYHQNQSKNRKIRMKPLIELHAKPNPDTHNNHHFESQSRIPDKVIKLLFCFLLVILTHYLLIRRPSCRFRQNKLLARSITYR